VLRFNSLSGEYLFISCKAALVSLPIIPQNRGAALNRRFSFGAASFIYDSNTTDNTCAVAGAGSQPLPHAANQSSAN
jgi:hypothetical protein